MNNFHKFLLCLPLLLASCAELSNDDPQAAGIARNQMLGITKDEAFTCLGPPEDKAVAGRVETWSYIFDKTCKTSVTIADDNRVKAVDYSYVPDKDAKPSDRDARTIEERCQRVPQIIGCVRWLRH